MKILAIDTTEQACSAALLLDGRENESFRIAARQHSRLILPMVEGLLADAGMPLNGLDGLAFARGPGSFTGVRIAAAVTQGLAVAADLPVVPVSSLLALAQGVRRAYGESRVLAAFDARMNEVYWAPCGSDGGLMRFELPERVGSAGEVALPSAGEPWAVAGSALAAYRDQLGDSLGDQLGALYPDAAVHARDVAALAVERLGAGGGVPAEQAIPVYLRDQVAQKASGKGS